MPRVTLQPGEQERFRETQRLWRNPIIAVLLPMDVLVVSGVLLAVAAKAPPSQHSAMLAVWFAAAVCMPACLATLGFTTVVTDRRLVVRWWPPFPGRDLPLDRLRAAELVRYNALADAGGWGGRGSPRFHRVFNISGDHGVHVRTGDGPADQFLIGSRRAEELAAALRR